VNREILFYSDFPFGYHNPEAEEKMARFARRGYDVHYVEQLGIRNPRPRDMARIATRAHTRRSGLPSVPFDVVSPKLLPPRGAPLIDRINRRWLARQLAACLHAPGEAIFWIRFPTPELVPFVERASRALVVYEVVDDHERGPGMNDRLRARFRLAEDRLLSVAGLVFAWSEPIRYRLARLHPNVVPAPTAVDVERFAAVVDDEPAAPPLAVYVGSADFRFDAQLLAEVASALPEWRFILAGPVERSVAARLEPTPNVHIRGRVVPSAVPGLLARAAVCLLPYRRSAASDWLFPIKLVEYLAAGRPIVATAIRAANEFADVVSIADTPAEFAAAIEQSAREDSDAARQTRVSRARPFSWDRRVDEMEQAIQAALARGPVSPQPGSAAGAARP
jgi:glycosyltransferase involved in cell wall biosynthesis